MMIPRRPILLREWRTRRGLTQEQLAALAGLTQGMISQLENDESDYSGDTLWRLSTALQCDPRDLFEFNGTEDLLAILDSIRRATPGELGQIRRVTDALKPVP